MARNGGAGVAYRGSSGNFGEAEVEQFDAGFGDQDVARLQIAVDHALDVRGMERVGRLNGILQSVLSGSGPRRAFRSRYSITR